MKKKCFKKYSITSTKFGLNTSRNTYPLPRVCHTHIDTHTTPILMKLERDTQDEEKSSFPCLSVSLSLSLFLSLPSKTLKRRRPRHPGFLQPGSVPRVHCVSPVHVPRVEVSLGVRKASLSHSVVLAHYQRVVVERRERCLVLLPPQMFGRLRTHAGSAATAGDQGRRPHFPAGRVHPPFAKVGLKNILCRQD